MKTISCFVLLIFTASVAVAQQRWHYPPAPRADVVDNYFGRTVADPYRPPVLLRVEKSGSHGYRPTDRVIAEIADEFAFALANLTAAPPRP